MLANLELVRGSRAEHWDFRRSDAEYGTAFRRAGLDFDATEPVEIAKWMGARSEPVELAGYLDDWANVRRGTKRAEADWRRVVAAAGGRPRTVSATRYGQARFHGRRGDCGVTAAIRRCKGPRQAECAEPDVAGASSSRMSPAIASEPRGYFGGPSPAGIPADFSVRFEFSMVYAASSEQAGEEYRTRPEERCGT